MRKGMKAWLLGLGMAAVMGACGLMGEAVQVVPSTHVCMIQNSFMHAAQTPVALDGKTYHVCCEGCKGTITKFKAERRAKDPVSGKEIDKSEAVIGSDKRSKIYYFENEANLKAFRAPKP